METLFDFFNRHRFMLWAMLAFGSGLDIYLLATRGQFPGFICAVAIGCLITLR